MTRIVWLASFPKCGNTWLRLLLANLDQDAPVSINAIKSAGGIASGRERFDNMFLFAAGLLTHDECDALRPVLYRALAEHDNGAGPRFVKTHDAWTHTSLSEPLMGGADAASGAILIVRDPRDVAASLANHMGTSIDKAIAFMASSGSQFCGKSDRQPHQLRQRLLGWSGFARSWLEQDALPVHLLRYEDLHCDTAAALGAVLAFAGVEAAPEALKRAARHALFAELQAQERAEGFDEAPRRMTTTRFFRQGLAGGWRGELTEAQRRRIEADHAPMMRRLGYEVAS
ncbi:hypothetical protein B2G71_23425 [Novosphingobium sp. PC22D]|uniref:sulfotransferase domain-containing protein n=1 Tax=Novosphingobium sp. PC22D TaxID=1962403 RepID=UPI000BFABA2E|nr:sulfotransferase domain-containing protein [Novosphingobium sp. PC22D]PEQ10228.1 hypothetical protein B2G71_23425 [Novosphingobium sp. PC22D]